MRAPLRIFAMDCALARCSVAVLEGDHLVSERARDAERGHAVLLPVFAEQVLADSGLASGSFDLVAVTVGPGGFTGVRAGLAFAHGYALAAGLPLVGVTVSEAFAEAVGRLNGRRLWTAIDSHRGRVFLDRDGIIAAVSLDDLPAPAGPVALAGDAAASVASRLAARGHDVVLTEAHMPHARHVASAGRRRLAGELPALPPRPLYVDPPEARLPWAAPRAPAKRP
jgi:tRNA threonylcarbamoyladenosine biosynthesis protein TsaB